MNADRTLPWDWYPGRVPENVVVHEDAYLETSYSFELFPRMGHAGRKHVEQNYNCDVLSHQLVEIYLATIEASLDR